MTSIACDIVTRGPRSPERPDAQLDSLYAISVEIAGLRQTRDVMDRALEHCLGLTASAFGFVGVIEDPQRLDVAAIKGFAPHDATFWDRFRSIPIRPSVFGMVVIEGRPRISNDVQADPYHVAAPSGHPPVRTFLGVPLRVREHTIGMIGVANRAEGYEAQHERLLSTFANQVAVALDNARLYERQQALIADLRRLNERLDIAQLDARLHEERIRIAEGLHDRVAQIMFSIGIGANTGIERVTDHAEVLSILARIRELANRGADEIRRTVYDLASNEPAAPGLLSGLRRLVADFDQQSDTRFTLTVDGRVAQLAPAVEDVLLLVCGEALLNIQRHAQAHAAVVSLRFEGHQIDLAVQDDGVGASADLLERCRDSPGHFGLNVMARRLASIGAALTLDTSDDGGLLLRARVPLPLATRGATP